MRIRNCAALVIIASAAMVGCGVEDRQPLDATGGSGGEAGQGGTGGGGAGGGGAGGGTAGSGGSDHPGCERTDEFGPAPKGQIDLLWVIDNSKAMAPFADRVASNLKGVRTALEGSWIDYRFAVTTTGLEESPDCDGPVGGGEDGRLVPVDGSRPRILDPSAPDFDALWSDNVAVGACHDNSHPLEAAWRALSEPLANHEKDPRHDTEWMDGNAGFLRPDALLALVFVTPVGDIAAGGGRSADEYLALLKGIKRGPLLVSAITGPEESKRTDDCQAEAGDRLIALTEKSFGFAMDICSLSDDGREWLPQDPDRGPNGHFLKMRPKDKNGDGVVDESDLAVSVDGVAVSARKANGDRVWFYSPSENSILFVTGFVPLAQSIVRVSYFTCAPR